MPGGKRQNTGAARSGGEGGKKETRRRGGGLGSLTKLMIRIKKKRHVEEKFVLVKIRRRKKNSHVSLSRRLIQLRSIRG